MFYVQMLDLQKTVQSKIDKEFSQKYNTLKNFIIFIFLFTSKLSNYLFGSNIGNDINTYIPSFMYETFKSWNIKLSFIEKF